MNNRVAYTTVTSAIGWTIGLATENVKGYARVPAFKVTTDKQALEEWVDMLNGDLGLDKWEAFEIVFSSM